jgi:hypothetical protein
MNIFLDTEFNDFGGDLIALALVADDGREFYETVPCPDFPWVRDNVLPVLNRPPLAVELGYARTLMARKLQEFLLPYRGQFNVIADWPEDFAHFFRAMILTRGQAITVGNFTTQIVRNLPHTAGHAAVPHNALHDARALRRLYYAQAQT